MGGPSTSEGFLFNGISYYIHTLSLNAASPSASANLVFVYGGTLTASVVVHDMHVYSDTFLGTHRATDSYDVSGVFAQGLMLIGLSGPLVDFRVEGADTIYLGDAGTLFYWARQLTITSVASITVDNGVGIVLPGRLEEGYIAVYPRVTTTYTLTAVYTNGLTITRTATIYVKSRKWSEMDMAQDHASGLITIVRSQLIP